MDKKAAYQLALKADREWSKMLHDIFGKAAGDVRYTAEGKGKEGTVLRAAHDQFVDANAIWLAAMKELAR